MSQLSTEKTIKKLTDDAKILQENASFCAHGIREDAEIIGENVAQASRNLYEDATKMGERVRLIGKDLFDVARAEAMDAKEMCVTGLKAFAKARPLAILSAAFVVGCFLGSRRN